MSDAGRAVRVAVEAIADRPERTFSYLLPDALGPAQPGALLLVPYGSRLALGYLLDGLAEPSAVALREVEAVVSEPMLTSDLLDLAVEVAIHYRAPLGTTIAAMLPPGLESRVARRWFVADPGRLPRAGRRGGRRRGHQRCSAAPAGTPSRRCGLDRAPAPRTGPARCVAASPTGRCGPPRADHPRRRRRSWRLAPRPDPARPARGARAGRTPAVRRRSRARSRSFSSARPGAAAPGDWPRGVGMADRRARPAGAPRDPAGRLARPGR